MNPTRLAELERQRALVREQLAWLEREIAREASTRSGATAGTEAGRPPADASSAPVTARTESASKLAAYPTTPAAVPASVFDKYEPDAKNAAQSARRGCLLAAVSAFVALVIAFMALYFYRYSDRPMLFPSRAAQPAQK